MPNLTPPAVPGLQCIAIVSDGGALPAGDDLGSKLRAEAEFISDLARVPARPMTILAADAAGLAAGIRALPAEVGAVLLTGVALDRAREVSMELQDGPARPLVTDEDLSAIALTAAIAGSLAGAGQGTHRSRVVLAGAGELPALATLLMACGVSDVTTWNQSDAMSFPLINIVSGVDTVVDLVGELPSRTDSLLAGITVITRDDAITAPYAAAGLLRAALCNPGLVFDVETYRACALTLAAASPFTRPPSYVGGVSLSHSVADAVTGVFHAQHSR